MIFNKCRCLIIGFTETRNRQCFREYCRNHNSRLKVSPGTKPGIKCGKGTKNKYMTRVGYRYSVPIPYQYPF